MQQTKLKNQVETLSSHKEIKVSLVALSFVLSSLNLLLVDKIHDFTTEKLYIWFSISVLLYFPFFLVLFFMSRYFSIKKSQEYSSLFMVVWSISIYFIAEERIKALLIDDRIIGLSFTLYLVLVTYFAQVYNRIGKVLKFAAVDKFLIQNFLVGFTVSLGIGVVLYSAITAYIIYLPIVFFSGFFIVWNRVLKRYSVLNLVNQNILEIRTEHTFFKIITNRFYFLITLKSICLTTIKWFVIVLMFFQAQTHYKNKESILNFEVVVFILLCLFVFIIRKVFTNQIIDKFGRLSIFYIAPLLIILFSVTSIGIHYKVSNQHEAFMGIPSLQMVITTMCFVLFLTYYYSLEDEIKEDLIQTIVQELRADFSLLCTMAILLGATGTFFIMYGYFGKLDDYHELLYAALLVLSAVYLVVVFFLKKDYYNELEEAIGAKNIRFSSLFPVFNLYSIHQIDQFSVNKFNLSRKIAPTFLQEQLQYFLSHTDDDIQALAIIEALKEGRIDLLVKLQEVMNDKRFGQSKNATLIIDVHGSLSKIQERLEHDNYIEQLSLSKLSEERILGAFLSSKLPEEPRNKVLKRLLTDPFMTVRRAAIISSTDGEVSDEVLYVLANNMSNEELQNVVIDASNKIGDRITNMLYSAFNAVGQNVLTQQRILQLYGILNTPLAYEYLQNALNHTNQNVYLTALDTLSVVEGKITKHTYIVEKHIEELAKQIIWNYMAIVSLDTLRTDESNVLVTAIKEDSFDKLDAILRFCSILYDYQTFNIIRPVIYSTVEEEINFGVQLLEVALPNTLEVKPMIIIFLKKLSFEDKIKELNIHWPVKPENLEDVINKIIYNDAQLTNRWSRICALTIIPSLRKGDLFRDTLITQLENQDHLIQQTAFIVLSDLVKPNELVQIMNRLTFENKNLNTLWNNYTLKSQVINVMEILMGMKTLSVFSELDGDVLCEIVELSTVEILDKDSTLENYYFEEDVPYIYVHKGEITMNIQSNQRTKKMYIDTNAWFMPLEISNLNFDHVHLKINKNAVQILKIDQGKLESLIGRRAKLYEFIKKEKAETFDKVHI
ncbi:hypothetical protein [Flammeovirga kamogawensis]|uniref:HEAT repeat domain-containing protein n=1 Tax=Flammeovirga kamogawensis TaxID=373891 RepID=A0ABX8GYD8_9BACT|nr:hypothetical protein [Flammeovirga kamogawensis]MBB6458853.1 hypothetical protein [Flammeovirga kamogawensis]QWG08434.1 hypothetical protein KM029_05725 [Flammeovirga kamogawensis]TRX66731.1 hypothetical protein EO216_00785 [Flammeovirga kamogawensis]